MEKYDYRTILEYIRVREPMGLELLYERYGRPFHRFALDKWKLDEEDAWEVVYKTLETMVLKLPGYEFDSQAKFDGFLFTVFINFLRQRLRAVRSKRLPQLEFFDLEQEFILPANVREALTKQAFSNYYISENNDNSRMREFKACLENLPKLDRDLLLLRAQNYSYDEIAAMLGLENNQLKVKYHRAKEKLIKLLNETK